MNTLVWPDSAMIRSGKPLFLPDDKMRLHIGLVAKINAVGKTIRLKFAGRYFNETAPAAFFLTEEVSRQIANMEDPPACHIVSDYSVICGDFISSPYSIPNSIQLGINPLKHADPDICTGHSVADTDILIKINEPEIMICNSIVAASVRNTLKTGDLVGFMLPEFYTVTPEKLLKVRVDGRLLIENKLK